MYKFVQNQLQHCNIEKNGEVTLKKDHKYYYQIISQLRITNREFCYFVIYTTN